ncbi:hypothetical protein G7072_13330 [Nocardioides sp. HDW12B]|uniref:FUSC family protein n=1 Tax=Nocardioides sp. HDW12B TaxID=2714939 RepID=UPI00140A2CF5|nr:FUSC family protein [Nocardioides sp. HDW12B]QIK67195.1 hypothetical protein G7072_13330 [Nocardioides sp. HDW12B]
MAATRDGTLSRARRRFRLPSRGEFLFALRLTVAAVLSYVAATLIFPEAQPLLAPLTAMLVVQVTPASLLARGLDRVIAVVAGVSIAVGFATLVPLEWWTLGLLILVALSVGQMLRLEANLIEVAISAMLVLGVGSLSAGSAAWERMTETLVGAAVAVAANLLFPPKVAVDDAGEAVDDFADRVSGLLQRAAEELTEAVARGHDLANLTPRWLDEARSVTHDFPAVEAAVLHAEEGRRMNMRAAFTSDAGPGLRQGLEALEHTAVSVRSMFRAVDDAAADSRDVDREVLDDIAQGLAQTFTEMHQGVDAFGQLVHDEATPGPRGRATDVRAVAAALEGLHEARTRLEEVLVTASVPELVELTAAVLATVRRLLQEMDLDERIRRQMRSARFAPRVRTGPAGRPRPGGPHRQAVPSTLATTPSGPGGPGGPGEPDPTGDPDAATELMPRIDVDATTQLMARIERDRLTGEPRLPDDPSREGPRPPD